MTPKKGRFRPFDPAAGPWLIWSHHWGRWHMRNGEGGASGYTDDVLQAGVFDLATAKAYHDPPPYRRDEAIPGARAVAAMEGRLAELDAQRDAYAMNIVRVRSALDQPPRPRRLPDLTPDQRAFLARFVGRGWLSAIRDERWEQETVDLALRKRWMRREASEAHFTPTGRRHLDPA